MRVSANGGIQCNPRSRNCIPFEMVVRIFMRDLSVWYSMCVAELQATHQTQHCLIAASFIYFSLTLKLRCLALNGATKPISMQCSPQELTLLRCAALYCATLHYPLLHNGVLHSIEGTKRNVMKWNGMKLNRMELNGMVLN